MVGVAAPAAEGSVPIQDPADHRMAGVVEASDFYKSFLSYNRKQEHCQAFIQCQASSNLYSMRE